MEPKNAPNIKVATEQVDVDELKPHPANPRHGDVAAIRDSLQANGQYRPIVVNSKTHEILAGNHTFKAAKSLGWKTISVTWVEADEDEALRILLADNRTSDLGSYDDNMLVELLSSLPDLQGTGYDEFDLARLGVGSDPDSEMFPPEGKTQDGKYNDATRIEYGQYKFWVQSEPFDAWEQSVRYENDDDPEAIEHDLRARMLLSEAEPPEQQRKRKNKIEPAPVNVNYDGAQTVDIRTLHPYRANPREGDIGAIAESLARNGQYRPIVVRRETSEVLVGNHTWMAAKSLGWDTIAVVYLDVDDEQAARIVLADNRTADLGSYDEEQLIGLLQGLDGDYFGTAYTGDDLDELIHQASGYSDKIEKTELLPATRRIRAMIGPFNFDTGGDHFQSWEDQMREHYGYAKEQIVDGMAEMLGIPANTYTMSKPTRKATDELDGSDA